MDRFMIRPPGFKIFADPLESSVASSSETNQPISQTSSSSVKSLRFRPYNFPGFVPTKPKSISRQTSHKNLPYSSPSRPNIGKSPLKDLSSNQTFSKAATPKKPNTTALRRYRTEPIILALREEIKKETGITPKTPQKQDNPFEPSDLPGAMAKPWLSFETPSMFSSHSRSPEGFKWSIEHMATMNPVEISHHEVLRTEYLKHVQTESDEENAQANIIRFFDDESFHPPTPSTKSIAASDHSSSADGGCEPVHFVRSRSYVAPRCSNSSPRNVGCQTDIHISPKCNFDKYFADYQVQLRLQELRESMSGVRKRLFMDIEEEDEGFLMDAESLSISQQTNQSFGFDFDFSHRGSSGFAED